jgi:hypothetical protein
VTALDKYLASVKVRAAAATPGPWVLDERYPYYVYCDDVLGSAVLTNENLYTVPDEQKRANVAFAQGARTDVDRLVAMVERALKSLDLMACHCDPDPECGRCRAIAELERLAGEAADE